MQFLFVYITTKDREQALVEQRLAACVNILDGMQSLYWWDGAIQDDRETILIAKTRATLLDKLTARVKELHSYTCPCVVAMPLVGGNHDYFRWLEEQTAGADPGSTET